ncbi:heme-binding domain-containing protein [Xanthocytophaga flava]|uniref:heme-binding domain-containing protein n=1 Tax=Xanthocytophaga flava TaxID=3048013 RepID=UPI0028D3BE49|nr:heme-binding domain-containing protein [Xanthocytophaga flavus]MDJ1472608.1 heme-binding domain-containing protein [Xanthocytophaga flavus]
MKRIIIISALFLGGVFAIMQLFRPKIENPPVTHDFTAPLQVKNILVRACYDCHSNETNLRWYDQIQPIYSTVSNHIKDGRKVLNFSEWDKLAKPDQKAKLWESINQIEQGAMPIASYSFVHQDSHVSAQDLSILKNYLQGMVKRDIGDTSKLNDLHKQYHSNAGSDETLPKSLNGITYIPDYKNWQVISTSERFDNSTIRIIYGNDIAIKAVRSHNINPWPDGTIFAKAAWDELEDKDGNVKTGAFKQVEYMIKDSKRFSKTSGWGFARFKTPKLVPYGKTILFTQECINCHKPMSGNDLVFTFPIKN